MMKRLKDAPRLAAATARRAKPARPATPAILAAVIAACALALGGCAKKGGDAGGAAGGGGFEMPPMPVETAVAASQTVSDRFEAVGSVEAGEAVTIVSEINGTVMRLPFREGESIAKGELIAQLDDEELLATANRAEAWRDQQKTSYDRIKSVVEQGAGSPQALDDAAAALKMAEADLALARTRYAKTRIVAPFSGTVGMRGVSPGAFVRGGDTITTLVQTKEVKVTFSAPERYVGQLQKGTAVHVSTIAYADESLVGRVDAVEASLDAATRSVRIQARVANPNDRLRPGMSADVTAVLRERANAVTIPDEAVFAEGEQFFVYAVKEDNTVTRTAVTLGTRMADAVEVLAGLEPGTRVVRAGHQKLFEGAKVMPVESQPGQGTTGQGAAPESAAPAAQSSAEGSSSEAQATTEAGGSR
jgi:membrane fusion protein, multidrug efflux system